MNPKVNDKFLEWLNWNYGSLKKVTATRGKVHDYLGMTIDFATRGKVKFKMDDYMWKNAKKFPHGIQIDGYGHDARVEYAYGNWPEQTIR